MHRKEPFSSVCYVTYTKHHELWMHSIPCLAFLTLLPMGGGCGGVRLKLCSFVFGKHNKCGQKPTDRRVYDSHYFYGVTQIASLSPAPPPCSYSPSIYAVLMKTVKLHSHCADSC